MPTKKSQPTPRQRAVLLKARRLASSVHGITGVDFGYVYVDDHRTRDLGIRFHVRLKQPDADLVASQCLPRKIDGIRCDVVQAAYDPHAAGPRDPADPICPGISIGNAGRFSTGTLGVFVRDRPSGDVCVMSNWHVLCGSVDARPGDQIVQPGPLHAGLNLTRPIATLHRWIELAHGYDAAVAKLAPPIAFDLAPFQGSTAISAASSPRVGMRVLKCGAGSGLTHALVDGMEGSFPMNYTGFGDQVRWMEGIRLIPDPEQPDEEISLRGDSGAAWIDAESQAIVALHFGGEDGLLPSAEYAIAHPIAILLERLDVDFVVGVDV